MADQESPAPYGSNEAHLRDELQRVAGLVRAQLIRFRCATPEAQRERYWHLPDDYLEVLGNDFEHSPLDDFTPPAEALAVLQRVVEARARIERRVQATKSVELRFQHLCQEYQLNGGEGDAILLALLPLMHSTYRRWFGVLQQDAARVFPSVGLVAEMLSTRVGHYAAAMSALGAAGKLARHRLILLGGQPSEPLAVRPLLLDDRVQGFLLGENALDPQLARCARRVSDAPALRELPLPRDVANRLEMLPTLRAAEPEYLPRLRLEFSGPDPELAVEACATVAEGLESELLVVDFEAALAQGLDLTLVADTALREARLREAMPLFVGLAALDGPTEGARRVEPLLGRLAEFPHPAAIEVGAATAAQGAATERYVPFPLPAPSSELRRRVWSSLLGAAPSGGENPLAGELAEAFQLTYSQIKKAHARAENLARRRHVFIAEVGAGELFEACHQQATTRLVSFAQRIEPRKNLTLADVVLPRASHAQLGELKTRVRHHTKLHEAGGLGERVRLARGVTALFVGGSGTGKTMAAEALASEQRVDLYRVDLAACVSKWVGETEKNLSRIFSDAERARCMLFFDEADAMFGQRGEVKEARDRWANLEVNYLLQRIEEFSGVVILATNLRQNIDAAFRRRIHVVVEFPIPDSDTRGEIWRRLLPQADPPPIAPTEVAELAARFELSGGHIRNVVLDAWYRALETPERQVTLRHLVTGVAREYQKTLKPVTRGEFGPIFYPWATEGG